MLLDAKYDVFSRPLISPTSLTPALTATVCDLRLLLAVSNASIDPRSRGTPSGGHGSNVSSRDSLTGRLCLFSKEETMRIDSSAKSDFQSFLCFYLNNGHKHH